MPSVLDDFDASPRQETASALGGAPAAAPRVALPPGGPASPVAPPTPAATPAAQPQLRAFGDSAATRRLLYDNVLKATQAFEPLTNQRHTLALTDVAYVGPEAYTLAEQKKAILANQTLGRRLQGTWRLTDNATGQEVSRRKSVLANVPFMTEMGTFINNGTEYSLAHQMRLRPGVYTRQKANGELESHINVAQGKGLSHRVFMDPDTGIFRLQMGQARIPLLPILKAMGAKDSDLRAAWGNDLTAANMAKADPQAVSKVYAKLVRGDQPADPLSRNQAITEALGKMEIDPEVTKRTLGAPHKNLNAAAYLDITRKLLAVNRGEQQPDDRDALAYQTLVGPEDLFAERLRHARNAARLLLWKASSRGNLDSVPARTFEPQLQAALMSSGLGQAGEEVNPLEILDQQTRVTRMGVGGLPSIDSIPEESRSVHSSQLGFVDVLRTPECYDRETEVMTWGGWKRWPDVVQEDELACLVDGKLEFHRPQALYCYEYAGTMCGADTGRIDYLVTPEHRLWVKPPHKNGKYKFEQASAMRTTRRVLSGGFGPYAGSCLVMFRLPRVDALRNPKQVATTSCGLKNVDGIAIDDWAELVGWVLGEGSVQYTKRKPGDGSTYNVRISQSKTVNADNCCRIRNLLNRLPFSWCEPPSERGFVIGNKQLASYFRQFGTSSLRWIPEELLRARSSARQKLFESLMLGEGRKNKRGERTCFCSSSSRLAHDFQRLAFSLGYSTTIVFEPDERPQSNTGGGYVVHVHKHEEHNVSPRRCPSWGGGSDLYTEEYSGYVYCATVPGGLLYVRRRAGVGHWSGNSEKGGVELRLARAARKGPDGRIYTPVLDPKTGETVHKSPQDLADAVLAFPGEMNKQGSRVAAISGGNVRMVTRDKVNYVLPHMEDTFSPLGNMIPLKSAVKGQRAVMASRMLTQALPLVDAEAPLVQSGMPGQQDRSYEEEYAVHAGVLRSNKGGTVLGVSGDQIQLRGDDGQVETMPLNNHRVFNRKTFLHQTPVVKPGDKIQPGQLLAQSNYTDQNGVTAIGKNLRVGYVADRGHNFEDAISISASAAKRLTSEHAYQHGYEYDPKTKRGKKAFSSIFPAVYDKQTLAKFDDAGVIKPGTEVRYGEPLILAVQEKERTKNALHRGHGPSFQNATVTWDHRNPGVVTDVDTSDKGVNVVVKSMAAMEAGDKLAGRYGDKGVISRIIPDDQMPVAADGKPLEVLVNPLGLISRVNPAQIIEAALGKIAATTGRPYKLQDFGDTEDWTEYALKELQKHGMSDTEAVTDPETGRKIPGTLVGNRWFMKLHHSAESGEQGRGIGGYSSDETPSKGGYGGCFIGRQKIETARGPVAIAEICEKHLGINVRTFSENLQEWVYRPVTDWFAYRARISDLLTIETAGGPCTRESRTNRTRCCLYVTRNHRIPLFDGGEKTAGEITIDDRLITWGPIATAHQYEFLLGTLLGDASVNSNYVQAEHSVKQIEYVAWKQRVLSGLCPETCDTVHEYDGEKCLPSLRGKRHRGRQVRIAEDYLVHELRAMCYSGPGGKKRVTAEWLSKLSGLSVAVWVLDDGSIHNKSKKAGQLQLVGNIAAHGFGMEERWMLVEWLKQWSGETCSTNKSGTITLSNNICRRLIREIAAWVPAGAIPKSKALTRRLVAEIQLSEPCRKIDNCSRLSRVPLRVIDVRQYVHDKPDVAEVNVYDFTVGETHKYVAGHALVSNSKRVGMLELGALLSSGASHVIRDASLVRGQSSPQYWSQYMSGFKPPTPKVPFVYNKFVSQLKASGINVVRQGSQSHIMAMTDKDIDQLAGDRELQNADTVDWRAGLAPRRGGLFDEKIFGGHGGNRWGKLSLHEPMLNPVMEEPARRVLGLTENKFLDVLAGKEKLAGLSGPKAIRSALDKINLDGEIERARLEIKSNKKTARDAAVRRLGYLKSAQQLGIHPRDWVWTKVPVLPPSFRPVSVMGGGKKLPLVDDANYSYKELFDSNKLLGEMSHELGDDVGDERLAVYNALKGVVGLGDPIHPKNQERQVKGILQHVFGSSPKFGVVNRKLLGSAVDLVGRAVITPDPDLDMDHVGIPEDSAWDIYRPIVVRHLVRRGVPRLQAARAVEARSADARQALLSEMESRPVIINRAPTLHRYGMMAAWAKLPEQTDLQKTGMTAAYGQLTQNKTLRLSPLVVKGFGADFDGDKMNFHVPATDEAAKEAAEKMLPSKNLFNAATFTTPIHQPSQEYTGGLYAASARTDKKNRPLVFATAADAIRAYRRGEIGVDRQVEIMRK